MAEEATDGLNDLVHATTETGKAGEMVIKIKMRPIGGKAGQMEIDAEVKTRCRSRRAARPSSSRPRTTTRSAPIRASRSWTASAT